MSLRRGSEPRKTNSKLTTSRTNQVITGFESSLEKDLILLLNFDLNIQYYKRKTIGIGYVDKEGIEQTYTPHIFVKYRKDIVPAKWMLPIFYHVTYRQDLFANWKELKPKFKAARAYAKSKKWQFQIITEQEIRTPYLQNVRFLTPYRKLEFDWALEKFVLDKLEDMRVANPESLMLACFKDPMNRAKLIPVMWHLVTISRIKVDLRLPLNMHSAIWTL